LLASYLKSIFQHSALGNGLLAGLGDWEQAVQYYGKAAQLAPGFSFAAANRALGLYQIGKTNEALKVQAGWHA
jgi:tetratricopeptide (TPR) repeat protein